MTFNPDQALQLARETLDIEAEALMGLKSRLDARFSQAVQMMLDVQGRVVVTLTWSWPFLTAAKATS